MTPDSEARALVAAQAEDDGLWFQAKTAAEAYLQQELRKLHAVVENSRPPAKAEPVILVVVDEMREEARECLQEDRAAGISPDRKRADQLTEWANRLELTNSHLLEDIYDQCCEAIDPLVKAGRLPPSLVESVQQLAAEAPPTEQPAQAAEPNDWRRHELQYVVSEIRRVRGFSAIDRLEAMTDLCAWAENRLRADPPRRAEDEAK